MVLEKSDQIWNRAAMENGGNSPLSGDLDLSALLLVHGMVMNGGVDHAVESLNPSEFTAGLAGYRYFGFLQVADLLDSANLFSDDDLDAFTDQYWALIPSDSTIVEAFKLRLKSSPESFSSLT